MISNVESARGTMGRGKLSRSFLLPSPQRCSLPVQPKHDTFSPGGRGVLPYKSLMGTCGQPGYVFRDFCRNQGIDFIIFCLNQGIDFINFCLKQGILAILGR